MNEKDALRNAQANNARIYSLMFDVYEKVRNAKESIDALIACGADYYKGYKIVGGGTRKNSQTRFRQTANLETCAKGKKIRVLLLICSSKPAQMIFMLTCG